MININWSHSLVILPLTLLTVERRLYIQQLVKRKFRVRSRFYVLIKCFCRHTWTPVLTALWLRACIDHGNLEKEVAELRVQLHAASAFSEAGELKRALDRKERERLQLSRQLEVRVGEIVRWRELI